MGSKCIAFIGIDNFDIILYLSRILSKLDKKVLIADYSGTEALTTSIAKPVGVDCNKNVITYRKVDFTKLPITDDMYNAYDCILATYGFNNPGEEIKYFNHVIYVTNLFLHNLVKIEQLESYEVADISLLVRDVAGVKISPNDIATALKKNIDVEAVSYLHLDETDFTNAIACQHNQSASFIKISRAMKNYLLNLTYKFYPDISKEEIKEAYKKARRGV